MVAPTSVDQRRHPVIGPRGRAAAWTLLGIAFAALLALALWLHDTRNPTSVDFAVGSWLYRHTGTTAQQGLLVLSEPALTIGVIVAVALAAALLRRWNLVVFASVGPLAAVLATSVILKPIVNRLYGLVEEVTQGAIAAGYAFPSGHETGLASATTVLSVLLLRGPFAVRTKVIGLAVAIIWTVAGAAGLVRNGYHYATDTAGGLCVALVVVLGTALVVDEVWPRPAGRPPAAAIS